MCLRYSILYLSLPDGGMLLAIVQAMHTGYEIGVHWRLAYARQPFRLRSGLAHFQHPVLHLLNEPSPPSMSPGTEHKPIARQDVATLSGSIMKQLSLISLRSTTCPRTTSSKLKQSGLLFRNLNYVAIIKKPYYLVYTHNIATATQSWWLPVSIACSAYVHLACKQAGQP